MIKRFVALLLLVLPCLACAQSQKFSEGGYYGHSKSAIVEGEIRGEDFVFTKVKVFAGGRIGSLECGFGLSMANRIGINTSGTFSGGCYGTASASAFSGARTAAGSFPTLTFSGSHAAQGIFDVTLIPTSRKPEFLAALSAGTVSSTEQWIDLMGGYQAMSAPKQLGQAVAPTSTSNAAADNQLDLDQRREIEKQRISEEKRLESERKIAQEQNARDEKRRLEIRQQEEARWALEIKQRDERLSAEQKLLADKLRQQQDEQRKSLEREQQMAAQLREMQEKLQQQTTVAQQLQRQLEEAKAAASKVAVPQGGKHALIIGIDQYQSIPKLKNAIADAREVATTLRGFGYAIRQHSDLNERGFKQAIREFMASINPGDEVIVFYAGHGVQIGGLNFFLPADTRGESERQVRDEAIQLQRILDDLSEAKPSFALVIVDACRDNPFKGQGRNFGGRGLYPTTAASGQMIIFSAGANQQALDVLGPTDKAGNSVFTRVLVAEMKKPNLSIDRLARNVRTEVVRLAKSVGHEQVPALYDQSIGEFYLNRK